MSLASRARHPKQPTPVSSTMFDRESKQRLPRPRLFGKYEAVRLDFPGLLRDFLSRAKIACEVNEARKVGWAKTRGAFGGLKAHLKRNGLFILPWWRRDGYGDLTHAMADRFPASLRWALEQGEADHPWWNEAVEARKLGLI